MDEMNKLPEEQNTEEIKEQGVPTPETAKVSEPIANIPAPKLPIPKLPLIIGGAVAGVAAVAVTVGVILGGGGHKHSYGEWQTVDAPTCIAAGIEERVCECNERETRPIAALGHTEVIDSAVAATCTSTGLTEGKHCSSCGTVITAQDTIPMLSHTYDNKYDADCNVCGFERDAECAHTETEVIPGKPASCTANGLTDGEKCKKCGEIITSQSVIPVKPHTEAIDAAKEATCTATGLTEGKHCSVCSKVLVEQTVVPLKPHTEVIDSAVAATCTKTGLTEGKHCSVCSKVIVAQQTTSKLNHIQSNWIVDKVASKTEDGARHTECTMCGIKMKGEIIPATGSLGLAYTINNEGKSCTITGVGTCTDKEIAIPTSIDGYKVIALGDNAFADCVNLTEINLPDTIETIGTRAFYGCTGITQIKIPASVTSIGTQIFYKASNLSTVYYDSMYCSSENPFLSYASINKIVFGGSYVPNYFLYNHGNITEVVLKDSVTRIGGSAFENCASLESVTIPNSVTIIGSSAFEDCRSLKSINIGNSVEVIADYAFYYCGSLTSVTISRSVKVVGFKAFAWCSIEDVYYKGELEDWFNVDTEDSKLLEGANLYFNGELFTDLVIPDTMTNIPLVFWGCSSITSVTIPDSITDISNAFSALRSLTNITIPDSVTNISNAFSGCESLTSITIPDSVTIMDAAFWGCLSLTTINFEGTVKQWNAISKAYNWNYNVPATEVICSDGTVPLK